MNFTKTTLKNGLRIITVPMKAHSTATILVLVEAGSKYETKEQNGISHFLEHMCFKGTLARPSSFAITSLLDGMGAESNAFTSTEYTGYYAKAQYQKLPKLLDIVSDVYLNSIFPEDEIEKEKGVVIEEMNMYEDLPHHKVAELFEKLLYGDQPAGFPIIGNKQSVGAITRNHLIEYRKNQYVAKSTIVVVAGNFNEKKTIKSVIDAFATIPTSAKKPKQKVIESQKQPEAVTFYRDIDQSHLILGFRAFPTKDKRNYAASVLTTILGRGMSSRLFVKMREELGICYYVRASLDRSTDHGYFAVSAGVGTKRTEEAVIEILKELAKIKHEGILKEELTKAKDYMIGTIALGLESSDDYANYYGSQELDRRDPIKAEEYVKRIQAVTERQVIAVAKELFQKKNLNLAIVGPIKDTSGLLPLLSI